MHQNKRTSTIFFAYPLLHCCQTIKAARANAKDRITVLFVLYCMPFIIMVMAESCSPQTGKQGVKGRAIIDRRIGNTIIMFKTSPSYEINNRNNCVLRRTSLIIITSLILIVVAEVLFLYTKSKLIKN